MTGSDATLLDEQAEYYRERAGEYDEWWQRVGRYDHGPIAAQRWWDEVAEVQRALDKLDLSGSVLELACGTGWWTERLARVTGRLTCVDANAETIAVNQARLRNAGLQMPTYSIAHLFAWQPQERYDVVFFSFWLSHVPAPHFDQFWSAVATALKPEGRVFFIDSAPERSRVGDDVGSTRIKERCLNDGRTYRVVKQLYDPSGLNRQLSNLRWKCDVHRTETFFIHGLGTPPDLAKT